MVQLDSTTPITTRPISWGKRQALTGSMPCDDLFDFRMYKWNVMRYTKRLYYYNELFECTACKVSSGGRKCI